MPGTPPRLDGPSPARPSAPRTAAGRRPGASRPGIPIDVVAAAIVLDGRVLAALRPDDDRMAGHWEFPGGKAEPGETASDALRREIAEELDCAIEVGREVVATTHAYPFATIRLTTYLCTLVSGTPTPVEHAELRWLAASALTDVTWAPADIPAVDAVRAILATATEG